jgi:putative tryptophan/tyrosine transport system substrate-binding protein
MIRQSGRQNEQSAAACRRSTRRNFLLALGGAIIAPIRALAQQAPGRIHRIGVLGLASAAVHAKHVEALVAGLRDLGYVDGRHISLEYRWANNRRERLPELAVELVRLKVDILVTHSTPATQAARNAAPTTPVVMISIADPVAAGFAASLARPGGNVTGMSNLAAGVVPKHVELLAQLVPRVDAFAVLRHSGNPVAMAPQMKGIEAAARALRLQARVFDVRSAEDMENAFSGIVAARVAGVVVLSEPLFIEERQRIAELARNGRVPTVFSREENVDAGGLMSYGPSLTGMFRQAAVFVDKILRGARPSDLPVEEPTKLELTVNLRTARALGVIIPQSVLVRADRVIDL